MASSFVAKHEVSGFYRRVGYLRRPTAPMWVLMNEESRCGRKRPVPAVTEIVDRTWMKELGSVSGYVEQRAMGESMTTATVDRSGWVLYATTMFVIIGVMDIIYGLTMIINNEWLVFGAATVWYIDLAAWGWITLLIGVLGLAVAGGIYSGQTWARVLGVIAAGLTAIDAFFIMPYYPVWALAILAMSMLVIWAVTAHGDEAY